jgi:hypothetical protein
MDDDSLIFRDPDLVEIGRRTQAAIASSKKLIAQTRCLARMLMTTTRMPAHIVHENAAKRCSVCKMPFPPDSEPSVSKAFAEHVLKTHRLGQTSEPSRTKASD